MPETATGKGHGLFQTHCYALYQSVDIAFSFLSLSLSGQGGVGRIKMLKKTTDKLLSDLSRDSLK